LGRGLRRSLISGVDTNLGMLATTAAEPDFADGDLSTSYLDRHPSVLGIATVRLGDPDAALIGAVAAVEFNDRNTGPAVGFAPSGWRNLFTIGQRQTWATGDRTQHTELVMCGDQAEVLVGPWPEPNEDGSMPDDVRRRADVRFIDRSADHQSLEIDGVRHDLATTVEGDAVYVRYAFGAEAFALLPRFSEFETEALGGGPICPLPGTVISVAVSNGDAVAEGQTLMVVEAMKMEHQIVAAADATVTEVHFAVGDRVDQGVLLVSLES